MKGRQKEKTNIHNLKIKMKFQKQEIKPNII